MEYHEVYIFDEYFCSCNISTDILDKTLIELSRIIFSYVSEGRPDSAQGEQGS